MDLSLSRIARGPDSWLHGRVALGATTATVVVAIVWGQSLLDRGADLRLGAPPLYGGFEARVNWAVPAVVAIVILALCFGERVATHLSWSRLLGAVAVVSLVWGVTLALVDGTDGLVGSLDSRHDYLSVVPDIESPGAFLNGFVTDLATYPVHVQGHPPGLPLALWGLTAIGIGSVALVATLVMVAGATSGIALLVSVNEMAGEAAARRAAPFVVFTPAALTMVTSADALFMATVVWGSALVILATGRTARRSDALALGGGLLLGVSLFLTYGALPAALVAPAVALYRKRVRPLVLAGIGVAAVVLAFGIAGFWWWHGLQATVDRYGAGVGGARPAGYFLVANLAAFALILGPAAIAGLARLTDRSLWLLAGSGLVGVLLADFSGLSRGEVERIWLPFLPWLLVGTASLVRHRRLWLSSQAAVAVGLAVMVRSPW